MNTPEPYERRLDRTLPEATPTPPEPEPTGSALAVHRDPSIPQDAPERAAERGRPSVAWVRPSEMPTLVGSSWVGRGVDLQSELTRRARRTPGAASKIARRVTRNAIGRPEPSSPTVTNDEGLGL